MKKLIALILALVLTLGLTACSGSASNGKTYKVGICNWVDDASLNQIVDSIRAELEATGKEKGVTFTVSYDNAYGDVNVLGQIIQNFIADDVDLMVGVATPVAMAMQAATEGTDIPVVFSAVTDPVGQEIVESLDAPGGNITGTSDYLDTNAVMSLIFALDPDADKIGLLYNISEEASSTPIADAKAYLDEHNVEYVERTGTDVDEIRLAAQALVSDGVDAVFTPQDNSVMVAELSLYEDLANAGIPHYTGADSFALNGAFLGYGVDYANLGTETGEMICEILLDGKDPATLPVRTFDNGTATVNTETCELLGLDFDEVEELFAPLCISVKAITTAESFDDLASGE